MLDALVMDLESNEVIINGNNSAFEGTPFYGKDFTVTIEPLSHSEYDRLRKQYLNRRGNIDEAGFEKALFDKQVKHWSGFKDSKGNDIEYNQENKEKIINKLFFFCRAINIASLNARMEISEDEGKN